MTQPAAPELAPGMNIANRFRLERMLGRGGMGSVWIAHHLTLNVEVAVKFIDAELANTDEVRMRFEREAHAAAKIKSPHVVNILDYGVDEHGRPYIAMELLQGEELAKRLEQQPTLPLPEVVKIIGQACKGLGKAHAAGITHRDLKPENIFLVHEEDGPLVKILDFGIAKTAPVEGFSQRTGTGQILGTPLFMSPEQALGRGEVDFHSDLYSLSLVAYKCIAGRVPFEDCTGLGELIVAVTTQPPPPLPPEVLSHAPALAAFFDKALQKDPSKRFSSARELSDALALACDPHAVVGPPSSVIGSGVVAGRTMVSGQDPSKVDTLSAPSPKKSNAGLLIGVFVAVVAVAAGVAFALKSGGETQVGRDPASGSSASAASPPASAPTVRPAGSVVVSPVEPSAGSASAAPIASAPAVASAKGPVKPVKGVGPGKAEPQPGKAEPPPAKPPPGKGDSYGI